MREFRRNSLFSVGLLSVLALMAAVTSAAAPLSPARFARPVLYSDGGDFSSSVALGDLNGDGHLDAVVTNLCQSNPYDCSVGIVGVLLGKGDGTFQSPVIYSRTGSAGSAVIADVNGDGKLDLVTLTGNGTASFASVMLGNGDGTFQNLVNYDAGGYGPGSLAVADVSGDGHPDIVVGNELKWGDPETGEVAVLLGNGDGTFQPPVMYNCSGSGGFVAIRDLNGDGKPDLVVTASGSISVLLGNGDGTFQAAVSYDSGGPGGGAVAVEDVNGDGKLDLAVANGSPTVGILLGKGDGTFSAPVVYDTGVPSALFAQSVAIGDVNGDNKPDLVLGFSYQWCGPGGTCRSNAAIAVLPGNGNGTFQAPVVFDAGPHGPVTLAVSLVLKDLNEDSKPDVVLANYSFKTNYNSGDGVAVLLNTFTGKTTTALISSLNPSLVGKSVTFTATVSSAPTVPDGQIVAFYDGTTALASVPLKGGTAAFTTSSLAGRNHYIHAKYAGNIWFSPSGSAINQEVQKYSTTTALTASPNPSYNGQLVTFTATVTTSGPYSLTGTVKFWDGGTVIGSVKLNGTVATLKKSTLAIGTHTITAQYLSDSYNAKSSNEVDQIVQ